MYKILFVDDEEAVRKSIIKWVDWQALGFTLAGDAENGQEALEKVAALEPDVIITDIQMPYMDGLQLAEEVRREYPEKRVILFSGYDEFEYAKQAIKLGVTEYILKPVNIQELTELLKNLRESMDKRLEEKRDVEILRESYRRAYPVLREKFTNDWVDGRIPAPEIPRLLNQYLPQFLEADCWMAGIIYIDREKGREQESARIWEQGLAAVSVAKIFREHLEGHFIHHLFGNQKELGLLCALGKGQEVNDLLHLLNQAGKECGQVFALDIVAGLGGVKKKPEDMAESCREAREALEYRTLFKEDRVIYIRDVEPQKRQVLTLDSQEEAELFHALKFGSREEIQQQVEKLVGKMGEAKVYWRQSQSYSVTILNTLMRLVWRYELDEKELFAVGEDFYGELLGIRTKQGLEEYFAKLCHKINGELVKQREGACNSLIREAQQYIEANYYRPDLSVEVLCQEFHLSPSYFSMMFKKETGKNYSTYLTEVRMKKAVELLNTTDDKTYIIAAKVGYTEPNYFSYVFKRQFGVSPSKYHKGKQ